LLKGSRVSVEPANATGSNAGRAGSGVIQGVNVAVAEPGQQRAGGPVHAFALLVREPGQREQRLGLQGETVGQQEAEEVLGVNST
jgi:hypothetical protein